MWKYNDGRIEYDQDDEKEIRQLLIGHKVKVISNNGQLAILELDNGIHLEVEANEGCLGCGSGDYSINNINNVDNVITNVEFECKQMGEYEDALYQIFVFCEDTRINLLDVEGNDGNGWYGTGYTITVLNQGANRCIKKYFGEINK